METAIETQKEINSAGAELHLHHIQYSNGSEKYQQLCYRESQNQLHKGIYSALCGEGSKCEKLNPANTARVGLELWTAFVQTAPCSDSEVVSPSFGLNIKNFRARFSLAQNFVVKLQAVEN